MLHVRSLYRRSLRAAKASIPDQQAWAIKYVQLRFRDAALVRGGGQSAEIRMKEAETELARFVSTLHQKSRLTAAEAVKLGEIPTEIRNRAVERVDPAADSPRAPSEWDEHAVSDWLQQLGLSEHAPAFARCRVDGRLLLRLDEDDLSEELGVTSRLQRKRILVEVDRLREPN